MSQPLKILQIREEIEGRLNTLENIEVRNGYYAMFTDIKGRLAVIQFDAESIELRNQQSYKASRSLYIVLSVPMKIGAFNELEQLLFDTRVLLFKERQKNLNGLAISFKTAGDSVFEPAKTGNFITVTIPVNVIYTQNI
ncbi:hypothetical protein OW492_00490 [Psychromonas sp. 14N.309.X.WAT.B.A12]|uniref:hypothetical protein n=1 Tax=Psychromonas sp. 14N.309.X.WAT.B.A12 TaxID=2998322 RepID=UPI0025AF5FC3|nr:hypothetical protein [Psychromonas sp. 14N.309.X.WAT.B.A12]MDN2661849.1 hypothetical protein [Psychromonas sp. 14N.309.X.WAT.B.A12]